MVCRIVPVCLAFIFLVLPANLDAGILVDAFDQDVSQASGTVYSKHGIDLNRTFGDLGSTSSPIVQFSQNFGFISSSDFYVTYSVSSGDFGSLLTGFDTGILFNVGKYGTGSFTYNVLADGVSISSGNVMNSNPSIQLDDVMGSIGSAQSLTFEIEQSGPNSTGTVAYFGGEFSAVPEPTSLMLAGMGLMSLAGIRRRRS